MGLTICIDKIVRNVNLYKKTELDVADYIFQKWLQQYFSTYMLL